MDTSQKTEGCAVKELRTLDNTKIKGLRAGTVAAMTPEGRLYISWPQRADQHSAQIGRGGSATQRRISRDRHTQRCIIIIVVGSIGARRRPALHICCGSTSKAASQPY